MQNGPQMSRAMYQKFFKPRPAKMWRRAKELAPVKVMLHCCGGYAPLLPAMIEVGLDAVHAVQPSCRGMDLRKLKADFGDRMVFNGAIDSHHVLIDGTPDLVRRRTREVLEIMMPGGGYIAGASHDYILEETPVENVVAMFDTVEEYGRYNRP
ncbi:MAG TPA: uroporphyrinogen decarboxylase family protein, partial [Phycisphaerae bacterium]|nr:uroporphyrinogen decarboxylase family protein [Phycisphaerae bacterium]